MQAIINAAVFDGHTFLPDGYVKFDRKIVEVGEMSAFDGCAQTTNGAGCVLLPGFVNAHHHSYTVFGRGWRPKSTGTDLMSILKETWWKLDAMLGGDEVYAAGLYNAGELIKNGVTTVIEHHASGRIIEGSLERLKQAMGDEMGLRGIYCFETSDRFPLDACIRENQRFMQEQHSDHAAGLFGMNAGFSLSDTSLKRIHEAVGDGPIHIHVGESEADSQICLERYRHTALERLDHYQLLNRNSILAHCANLGEGDWDLLRQAEVHVALNLTSNLNNGVAPPDYRRLKAMQKPILLGCDGHSFDFAGELKKFYYIMRERYLGQAPVEMSDIWGILDHQYAYAGTLLGCRLGRVEPGYEADFVLTKYESPTPLTKETAPEHYLGGILESFCAKDVWCGGVQLLKDGMLLHRTDAARRVCRMAEEIWKQF